MAAEIAMGFSDRPPLQMQILLTGRFRESYSLKFEPIGTGLG